ncbi:MAG TPA: DUF202 domain-containing protein [Burkholderiaceae bacterium]|nr:DUF202 domain-containing protein [Burkholderiaceae bacterium]
MKDQSTQHSDELAESRTSLAKMRTLMALDRSLMAWIRTSLAMISFGFAIYELLYGLQQDGGARAHVEYSPVVVGLFLTGLGTAAMVAGTLEYWQGLRELRPVSIWRTSFITALIMSIAGSFVFMNIVIQQL